MMFHTEEIKDKSFLITGGAGFIGSHVVRRFVKQYPNDQIFNLDALTYAGNLENLKDIDQSGNYHFIKGDITDTAFIQSLFETHQFDGVIHLAAESHVDRSISNPMAFVLTNVIGTVNLLNAAKHIWKDLNGKRFYHVSTDEVYGQLGDEGKFVETTPYDPNSPYSASKASSDHFVRAYNHTYGLPVVISNCSNNYGSHHFPEKLIPLMINNILQKKPLPVYGKGENVRDWIFVDDHSEAVWSILEHREKGETYGIGGMCEKSNIDLVHIIIEEFAKIKKQDCDLAVNYIVHRSNYKNLGVFTALLKSIGVENVRFSPMYVPDFYNYHELIAEEVNDQLKAIQTLCDDRFTVNSTYNITPGSSHSSNRSYRRCWIMQTVPVVGADMNVYACHNKAYDYTGCIGSIKDQSFKQLWESPETKEYFEKFNAKTTCLHECSNDRKNIIINQVLDASTDNFV